jgi:hypothetical protein
VEALLARGADPRAKDAKGRTADAFMADVETFHRSVIDLASRSRARDPTTPETVAKLKALRERHARVRALLAAAVK